MIMNKNTAIGITIATALLCGCPGLFLAIMGIMAAMGSQMPEVMAQNPTNSPQEVLLGSGMFLCFGAVLILIPIVAGIISFRAAKSNEPVNSYPGSNYPGGNDPMPPAA
jgi:hypothetical protein